MLNFDIKISDTWLLLLSKSTGNYCHAQEVLPKTLGCLGTCYMQEAVCFAYDFKQQQKQCWFPYVITPSEGDSTDYDGSLGEAQCEGKLWGCL